jgi:hypothetical protein
MRKFETGWTMDDGVTQSLLGTFVDCPQRAKYQLDGWEPKREKASFKRGSIVHNALYHFYSGLAIDKPISRDAFLSYIDCGEDDDMHSRLGPLLTRYWDFAQHDTTMKWHTIEREFATRFKKKFLLRGKWDGEFEDPSGKPWLLETKTMSRISEDNLLDQLLTDGQLWFYYLARQSLYGVPPAGVLYNILRYPGHRRKVDETWEEFSRRIHGDILFRPEHYFKRLTVTFDTEQVKVYTEDLRRKLVQMRRWTTGRSGTIRNTRACFGAYTCDYVDACVRCSMAAYTQTRKPFPELEEYDVTK